MTLLYWYSSENIQGDKHGDGLGWIGYVHETDNWKCKE